MDGCEEYHNYMRKRKSLSEETKKKISEKLKGHVISVETRKKISATLTGKKFPIERVENLRKRLKENNPLKGRKATEEHKQNLRKARRKLIAEGRFTGKNHWNWRGGVTPAHERIRKSLEYKIWRKAVFERDNYTCVWCGDRSKKGHAVSLHADHIKPFAIFPELRFAIDNGRTLCVSCHRSTDTYGAKTKLINRDGWLRKL